MNDMKLKELLALEEDLEYIDELIHSFDFFENRKEVSRLCHIHSSLLYYSEHIVKEDKL